MSLQTQVVSIPMSLGIDTENSPPLIEHDRFANLSNVVFNKDSRGQLHKRSGHAALPTAIQGGGVLPAAQLVANFNDELDALANGGLYGFSYASQNWVNRGAVPLIQPTETSIAAGAFSVANPDACSLNGLVYYTYEMNGDSWVKIVDDSNKSVKATIRLGSLTGAPTFAPKILTVGDFEGSTGTGKVASLSVDSTGNLWLVLLVGTSSFSVTNLSSTIGTLGPWFVGGIATKPEFVFDAIISNPGGTAAALPLCIFYISSGNSLKASSFNIQISTVTHIADAVVVASLPLQPNSGLALSVVNVAKGGISNGVLTVTWQASTGGFVNWREYTDISSWTVGSSGVAGSAGLTPCPRLTTASVPTGGAATLGIFYEQAPSGTNVLPSITYWISGSSVGWSTGCNIATQPFVIGSNIYLPVVYPSTVQQTLFLTFQAISSTPANVLAQVGGRYFSANDAGAAPSNYRMGAPFAVSDTTASLAVMVQPQGSSAATVAASLAELALVFTAGAQYLIPSDAQTIMHVSATDLNGGTAAVGPAWVKRGTVPYSSKPTPIPSVGPFATATYQHTTTISASTDNGFTLPAPSPLNIASSFSVTAVISVGDIAGSISNVPFIVESGSSADFNFWGIYIETSGPSIGHVGFEIGTSTLSVFREDQIPYYDMSGLLVISAGYDAATNNIFLKVNNRPILTTNLGGAFLATSTESVIGNYNITPTTNTPLNGNLYEVLASTNKPTDSAFISIYNKVLANILSGPAQFSQLGGNLHLACGSQLMDYDGTNLVEHNFHVFPETMTATNLASQISIIIDSYDPTFVDGTGATAQGTFRIAIPDNPTTPGGPIGQFINQGMPAGTSEYITFGASSETSLGAYVNPTSTKAVVYFVVSGVGAAPVGTGAAVTVACNIQTTSNATQVATALAAVLQANLASSVDYTTTYTATPQTTVWTPQYITVKTSTIGTGVAIVTAPPALSRYSTANQVFWGGAAAGTPHMISAISFPPASLISTSQYAAYTTAFSGFAGFSLATFYFWFSNPSNSTVGNEVKTGGDPAPYGPLTGSGFAVPAGVTQSGPSQGNYFGVKIALLGNETEIQVATAVKNAMAALATALAPQMPAFSVSQVANVVSFDGPVQVAKVTPPFYPTTNIGQGYVGKQIAGVGGLVAINYSAVAEWIDSQNQLHQSAPSIPNTVYIPSYTAVGGGAIPANAPLPISAAIQLSVNPISLTQKTAAIVGAELDFAIYRTISGATVGNQVYYRITPSNSPLFNTPKALTAITYADYSSDGVAATTGPQGPLGGPGSNATGIQQNQLIYTTGGVQPNSAPPACSYVINHQNRLWLSGLENPNELWYSETLNDGFAMSFTQAQIALVNPTVGQTGGGPIVALASMDSNLIVFQENQIWFIQGSGPDATGGNGFFATPQIVASSSKIGCRDPNSVVLQPQGVMFKSTQGFWLLGRDLSLKYVGAPVKTYNSDLVSSAVALANNSQINFLSDSGTTLMYDWYYDSWSTFTTNGTDSVVDSSGNFTMVTSTGSIWVQTPGLYYDGDGSPVIMSIQTAWLKPSSIQGFGRIWKAFLEGQFYGSQPYLVQIAYNYVDAPVDSFTFNNGAGGTTVGVWGASPVWGSFIWGEDGATSATFSDQIQIRVFPSNQLCESIQFTITDLPPVPAGKTWSLNALDLEIGVRRGGMKRIGNPQSLG